MKYYVVWKGNHPGVYSTWDSCKEQITGYTNALYKSFPSREEAEKAYQVGPTHLFQKKTSSQAGRPVTPSISVDAACSGNPGLMEYRCVDTATKQVIFASPQYPDATNNIGEFLALVHCLAYLKEHKSSLPVYTDSVTAMSWVKNKKVKTNLQPTEHNNKVFNLIDRAIIWLEKNHYSTRILKWDTEHWGEIPADYGRK